MTKKKGLAVGISVFFMLWLVSQCLFIAKVLSCRPDMAVADVVVVFTGGPQRLKTALDVYERTASEKLFITSVNPEYKKPADENVYLDTKARTTRENARQTAAFIKEHKIKKIKLVTAAYHMPRSKCEMRHADKDVEIFIHPVYPDNFRKDNWYKTKKSLKFLFMENLKYRFVQVEYFFKGSEK